MSPQPPSSNLQPVRNILVCLDLTGMDTSLIRYAAFLDQTLNVRKMTFFHVIQAYDLPDRANENFPDVESELKDIIRDKMRRVVDRHFENNCHWEVVTMVGYEDAARDVVAYIMDTDVDLTLIGQKYGENRKARYSRKIGAESRSDILFVPQSTEKTDDPVLCAIDLTQASVKAFERSLDISRSWGVRLICRVIADPARAYFPATTTRSSSYYQEQAQKACAEFLKEYNLSLEQVPCLVEGDGRMNSEAEHIYEAALREKAGLIVVGAQGETARETTLLGNLCETFRLMEKQIPVMIVKHASRKKFPWFWKSS